jgi:AcrR family transcriptional regulator
VDTKPGLRERKKQETRDALSFAALRLAVERGLDNVLVEDIAAAAGVSPRTFNNYFSSKAEAISSRHTDRMRITVETLRTRPADEPLWESITIAVMTPYDGVETTPDPQWAAGIRLMLSEPALIGEILRASAQAEEEIAAAVAERTGTNAARDLYPRLIAASVGAATQAAYQVWQRADPPVALPPLLREAIRQISSGLPEPR